MARTSLAVLFLTIWFTGLISGDVSLKNMRIFVWQIPEITANEGTNVTITCHIKASPCVKGIMVEWLRDNQTTVKRENFNASNHQSPVSGFVFINMALHLQSVHVNHSSMYYCKAHINVPVLGPLEYGNGTHVYVVSPNLYKMEVDTVMDTMMWSVLSGMGFVLLVICIACAIHIHYKGHCRLESRAKEALVDATRGSPCLDTHENVVYAALNIPRDSVKSRNENCPAPTLSSVTCTEESVTYAEVHLKKGPKDEG
ncbi:hypothetical protein Q8A67_010222 [Cirrhinus molitorella]|uniref:Ig-like domain-containing protein n=1 Tax=Cirrhinus molitorella TaxID=172907 RepID=A0AA88PRZ2_9TELE|nr:hypothetical protein Q8A67_010222 [Cirrhinus molitorella]